MKPIRLDYSNITKFVSTDEILKLKEKVLIICEHLSLKAQKNEEPLGWLNLPTELKPANINQINKTAQQVSRGCDVFICIGIGGSYLGAKAAIEALKYKTKKSPEIIFAGHNLSSDYLAELLESVKSKEIAVNVISKSGTTLEPAVTFRIIRDFMEKKYGKNKAKKRISVTTGPKGNLRKLARKEGYLTLDIPENIGGRYSVLSNVGLLSMAVAKLDIQKLIAGAKDMQKITNQSNLISNLSCLYAVIRYLLYQKEKLIEILATFCPDLVYFGKWWEQLTGESEGKNKKGIFPATATFTTDLHSLGQYIQDGKRCLFETFIWVEKSKKQVKIPKVKDDLDNLNYLANKNLDYINLQAFKGTALAHTEGGVPNLTIRVPYLDEYYLGQLFYFFEKAIAVSGTLLGVNPFNQPGVEAYKKYMLSLLGKK